MTAAFSARRRADEFEALLSRDLDTPLSDREAARFTDLLELVSDLRAVPQATPREDFVSSLRERLMVEADTVLLPQPAAPSRLAMPVTTRSRDRRVGALLGGAALVGATATMAVAAQTSLPGESLYGVKRGIESAQVSLAGDEAARGRTLLAQADTRLSEVEDLAADDGGTPELIPTTLDTFAAQSGDGVRSLLSAYDDGGAEQDVQAARDFTTKSMERLDALQGQLPESSRDELLRAGRTLTDLDLEISSACPTCAGGITTTPDFLRSSSALQPDLLTGLDIDDLTLEAAPVSGQDITGIVVPDVLKSPLAQKPPTPTSTPTANLTTPTTPAVPTLPTEVVPDTTVPETTPVKVKDITKGATDTTGDVVTDIDGLTGGAVGGLTTGIDDATGGLIGEVTGTVDGLTGGLVGGATGGLLH